MHLSHPASVEYLCALFNDSCEMEVYNASRHAGCGERGPARTRDPDRRLPLPTRLGKQAAFGEHLCFVRR
jgi:hypothetical protein